MEKKNKVSIWVVIPNCICAVVWSINVFVDLAYGFPNGMHICCAVVWDLCAVIWILRYLKSREENEESCETDQK